MNDSDPKDDLLDYLRGGRETLIWKLEGLSEYDTRRPLTPTGTNLLGLIKHSTDSHLRYFGTVFGRPTNTAAPWFATDSASASQFWATSDESQQDIVANYETAGAFADTTISELALDAVGHVPWWGNEPVTLHHIVVHVIADTQRHAGHADILREQIDGSAGLMRNAANLHAQDSEQRERFWNQVGAAANRFR